VVEFFIQQLVNGLSLGSIYALMAIGFTLIFGVLRLLNMAHGELYTLGAYFAFTGIVLAGLSPIIVLPTAILVLSVIALGIERVAFKPLRNAPHFIPLVSTIAVSTILLEAVRLIYGPYMFGFDSFIPHMMFDLGIARINLEQIFILLLSFALMGAVQIFLVRSKWGRAIRAVSQDTVVGGLLGINVDRVIGITFALGSALGGVAGILIGMYFGTLYPGMGFVALVKAFTAAILGGMGSIPGAVLGGILLGVAESLGSAYLPSGFSDAVPFVMLFLVLLLLPGGLTGTSRTVDVGHQHSIIQMGRGLLDRAFGLLPGASPAIEVLRQRSHWLALISLAIMVAVAPSLDDYTIRILLSIVVYALMALGTNLVLGLSGQLSLAHAAFFAIGCYSSAILTRFLGFDFWSAMAVGVVIACTLGFLVSLVTYRVKGYYLALITLAFAELVRIVISHWSGLTGGMMGIRGIPPIILGPWTLDSPLALLYLATAFCVGGLLVYQAITYSAVGRTLIGVRDDEIAARSNGINAQAYKIFAFTVGAAFPAVGGSILAHYYTAITPELASVHNTIQILVIVVIGGLGSAAGAVFGSAVVNLLPELFRGFGDYRLMVYGLMLFLVIVYQPQGMFSIARRLAGSPHGMFTMRHQLARRT
jgi:branched-chain amino acid transport system permease protein